MKNCLPYHQVRSGYAPDSDTYQYNRSRESSIFILVVFINTLMSTVYIKESLNQYSRYVMRAAMLVDGTKDYDSSLSAVVTLV